MHGREVDIAYASCVHLQSRNVTNLALLPSSAPHLHASLLALQHQAAMLLVGNNSLPTAAARLNVFQLWLHKQARLFQVYGSWVSDLHDTCHSAKIQQRGIQDVLLSYISTMVRP